MTPTLLAASRMPASPEVLYASLLRPFPTRALANALRPVQAEAYALDHALTEMLISPPGTPEAWAYELAELHTRLWSLANHCETAGERIAGLGATADRDFQTAISAARAMLAGLSVSGEDCGVGRLRPDGPCGLGGPGECPIHAFLAAQGALREP
jgi:hypothetical protein